MLCGFAFLAGIIDAAVGGGGLIQLPALLVIMPQTAIATLLGTNKVASIAGTAVAAVQYSRSVKLDWRTTIPASIAAFIFSAIGARIASLLKPEMLRPVILVILIVVAIYTLVKKDFGSLHAPKFLPNTRLVIGIVMGMAIGFYDGFLGPGTGSFLTFTFIGVLGFDFLTASASTKVVNFATNLSALIYFAFTDRILYSIALPMAVCNILGSLIGTKLALTKGSDFIRVLFLVVVSGLILKLTYDTFFGK